MVSDTSFANFEILEKKLMKRFVFSGILLVGVSLGGCMGQNAKAASVDQDKLCEVSGWQRDVVAAACKPGQKVVFLPQSFGNEQLPIIFAAVNCDLRYQVALTNGAVTCIYHPIKPAQSEP